MLVWKIGGVLCMQGAHAKRVLPFGAVRPATWGAREGVLLRCAGGRRAALRWRLSHLRKRENEALGTNKKRAASRRRKLLRVIRDNFKIT